MTLPREGRFAEHACAALLGGLWLVRATGALDITRRKLVRRFVLGHGRLQALVSNARDDRFFDWLVARGDLAAADPSRLTARQACSTSTNRATSTDPRGTLAEKLAATSASSRREQPLV